jgi:hypothetical protein
MNAPRVIHGIATFMLLGMAFVMLREFGVSYKFGTMGLAFRQYEGSLPWLSALVLPLAPIAWWCAFTPLCCAIGVAVRVPANSPVSLAIHWLAIVIIANVVVLGVFFSYLKATSVMGYPMITPPTPLEIGTNAALLAAAGFWMIRGIIQARRGT